MSTQHLHNMIGNAIGECKKAMYVRLKNGQDLAEAMAQFFAELNVKFDQILQAVQSTQEVSS